jgi:hypothetical protein
VGDLLLVADTLRNGAGSRLSDIVLVGAKDARRQLEFEKGETPSEKPGAQFSSLTPGLN